MCFAFDNFYLGWSSVGFSYSLLSTRPTLLVHFFFLSHKCFFLLAFVKERYNAYCRGRKKCWASMFSIMASAIFWIWRELGNTFKIPFPINISSVYIATMDFKYNANSRKTVRFQLQPNANWLGIILVDMYRFCFCLCDTLFAQCFW